MTDIVLGVIALAIGLLLCLRGYLAMRALISLFGAFVGFLVGAGLVADLTRSGFLSVVLGWVVGLVVAIVFGVLAYLSYQVAVVLGLASIGFALGTTVMAAFHLPWSWLTVVVGVVVGIVVAAVAIATDLPAIVLVILTALAGASLTVFGAMLLVGTINGAEFRAGRVPQTLQAHWPWYAAYAVLAVIGVVVQARVLSRAKRSLRQQWVPAAPVPSR